MGHISLKEGNINAYKIFVVKPEYNSQLGRRKHKWKRNVKGVVRKSAVRVWTEFIWHRVRSSAML
jgi:hypothetical protein